MVASSFLSIFKHLFEIFLPLRRLTRNPILKYLMKKSIFLLALPVLAIGLLFQNTDAQANSGKLQILKFEADWCGPCQMMKPVFDKVAKNSSSAATFRTINVDSQPSVADAYGVSGLPTVVAVKDGKVVGKKVGYMNAFALKSFVNKHK